MNPKYMVAQIERNSKQKGGKCNLIWGKNLGVKEFTIKKTIAILLKKTK